MASSLHEFRNPRSAVTQDKWLNTNPIIAGTEITGYKINGQPHRLLPVVCIQYHAGFANGPLPYGLVGSQGIEDSTKWVNPSKREFDELRRGKTMIFRVITICLLLFTAVFASGCTDRQMENTQRETEETAKDAGEAMKDAGEEVADTAGNIAEASVITPLVKQAIVRDKILNDADNQINVDTTQDVVYLKGHVQTAAMKARAGRIAVDVLVENEADNALKNELKVRPEGDSADDMDGTETRPSATGEGGTTGPGDNTSSGPAGR